MKIVSELIKELQEIVDQDPAVSDLPVYVFADHGQTFIQAGDVSVGRAFEYDYYVEPTDLEECTPEEMTQTKPFVIVGD